MQQWCLDVVRNKVAAGPQHILALLVIHCCMYQFFCMFYTFDSTWWPTWFTWPGVSHVALEAPLARRGTKLPWDWEFLGVEAGSKGRLIASAIWDHWNVSFLPTGHLLWGSYLRVTTGYFIQFNVGMLQGWHGGIFNSYLLNWSHLFDRWHWSWMLNIVSSFLRWFSENLIDS